MSQQARIDAPVRGKGKQSRSRGAQRAEQPRYDQRMRAAKNANEVVKFTLSQDAYFTDEDGTVSGLIQEVDKFDMAIELEAALGHRVVWLKKSHIMATEVL